MCIGSIKCMEYATYGVDTIAVPVIVCQCVIKGVRVYCVLALVCVATGNATCMSLCA